MMIPDCVDLKHYPTLLEIAARVADDLGVTFTCASTGPHVVQWRAGFAEADMFVIVEGELFWYYTVCRTDASFPQRLWSETSVDELHREVLRSLRHWKLL